MYWFCNGVVHFWSTWLCYCFTFCKASLETLPLEVTIFVTGEQWLQIDLLKQAVSCQCHVNTWFNCRDKTQGPLTFCTKVSSWSASQIWCLLYFACQQLCIPLQSSLLWTSWSREQEGRAQRQQSTAEQSWALSPHTLGPGHSLPPTVPWGCCYYLLSLLKCSLKD